MFTLFLSWKAATGIDQALTARAGVTRPFQPFTVRGSARASSRRFLSRHLHEKSKIYVAGLALDYCVKFTVLDARQLGFNAHVIVDACRGIALEPGDLEKALDEMKWSGATLLQSRALR